GGRGAPLCGERLGREEVDDLALGARARAPFAAGEDLHAQSRPRQQEQRGAEAVDPPRRRGPYSDFHASTSAFFAQPRERPVQSKACNWLRTASPLPSSSPWSCPASTKRRPSPLACPRPSKPGARPGSR